MGVVKTQAVIGLGNPGIQYRHTRHNIGFRILEELMAQSSHEDLGPSKRNWFQRIFRRDSSVGRTQVGWESFSGGEVSRRLLGGRKILLFRPDRFMNRSGEAVASFLQETKLDLPETLVIVDDIDLPFGHLRLKASGGPGTHNGLRNICQVLGSDFPRLRFGIRGTGSWESLADYVLSDFSAEEEALLRLRFVEVRRIIALVLEEGLEAAMNIANRKMA